MAAQTTARTPRQDPAGVTLGAGVVRVRDARVLGAGTARDRLCERFLVRVFQAGGVREVTVDRDGASAAIRHDPDPPGDPGRFLRRLAATVRDDGDGDDGAPPPALPALAPVGVYT